MDKEIEKEIDKLIEYSEAYYKGEPKVTDNEFDKLLSDTRDMISKSKNRDRYMKRLNTIVSDHIDGFKDRYHLSPMYSMTDIFTEEDALKWMSKFDTEFAIEPKYDGLSLNLIYKDGRLKYAITRGDGERGDDVTANAKTIRGIPHKIKLKDEIEIRGEVVMPISIFNTINSMREESGDKLLSNPRNAATGALKQKDPRVTASRKLEFYPYHLNAQKQPLKRQTDLGQYLASMGFLKPLFCLSGDKDKVLETYKKVSETRHLLNIMIDGLAIKINDLSKWDDIGVVSKYPKYSFAFKFPHIEVVTKLENVVNQVGKSGTITPVAILTPVNIGGVTVSRATLHNYDEIDRLDIRIGDSVILTRSGEVIPKILRVDKSKRTGKEIKISRPIECPSCGNDLESDRCINSSCPGIIIHKLLHFVSKDRLDIKGMGPSIIEELVNNRSINSYIDLLTIEKEKLKFLGERLSDKIYRSIQKAKRVSKERFLSSLGIPNIGRRVAKQILEHSDDFINITYNKLIGIKGIGHEIASDYVNFMANNRDMVYSLLSIMELEDENKSSSNELSSLNIVLTGALNISRDKIKNRLESLGANISNNVSKNTDLLIYGKNSGSKLDRARELGITLLDATDMDIESIIDSIRDKYMEDRVKNTLYILDNTLSKWIGNNSFYKDELKDRRK